MSGKSRNSIIFAGAIATLTLGWDSPAQACSFANPRCIELPPEGAAFPANAVAFRLFDKDPARCGHELYELTLRTEADNVAVPASAKTLATGERVFSPDETLEPGLRYVLRWRAQGAPGQGGPVPPHKELTFATTEPLSFPPTAGTLRLVAAGVMNADIGTGTTRVAFVKLQLVDTPESLPFRALRTYRVEVDDRADGLSASYTLGKSPEIHIQSVCDEPDWLRGPCNLLSSVPAGRHRVKVIPHVLGAASLVSPAETEIDISCDADVDPSNMPSPEPVPTNPAAGMEPGTTPESPAACAFVGGSQSGGMLGLVFGLVAMRMLRRRRHRASPSRPWS